MPIITFETLDSVPEEFKAIAKEVDGKIAVNVVPKATLDEFRDKNITLSKERDALLGQTTAYKAIVGDDTEGFTKTLEELRSTHQRVKDGELKETRQIEEALNKRTEEMRKDSEARFAALQKEGSAWRDKAGQLESALKKQIVAGAIKDACMDPESGIDPRAVDDVTNLAFGVFQVNDQGKVVPMDGDSPIYGSDGATPMSAKEWLARLKEPKPFFFKQSNGGGAGGDTTKKIMGVSAKELSNMSAAQRLELANQQGLKR